MRRLLGLATCVFALASCGCTPKEWVIVVENHSYHTCTIAFDVGPGHCVQSTEVKQGRHVVASGAGTLPLNRVVVSFGGTEYERCSPTLEPGYTYLVTIAPDRNVIAHVTDK